MSDARLLPDEILGLFLEQGLYPIAKGMTDGNGGACGLGAKYGRDYPRAFRELGFYATGYACGFDVALLGELLSVEESWKRAVCFSVHHGNPMPTRFVEGFEDARALVALLKHPPKEPACAVVERKTADAL